MSNPKIAIEQAEAAAATPQGDPEHGVKLATLSRRIYARYQALRDLSDLSTAIQHAETAVAAFPGDHPGLAGILSSLGDYLSSRYQELGAPSDLKMAVEHAGAAVIATPRDHPDRPSRLSDLSSYLGTRYRRLGAPSDLIAAIEHAEAAVAAAPEDHPNRGGLLCGLGDCLDARYERLGALSDIDAAVEYGEAAVAATPEDHPNRAGRLNNLGGHFNSRYQRLGALSDLGAAIKYAEAAVAATPGGHPDCAGRLNNLSNYLNSRYRRFGALKDLITAIEHAEASIELTPPDHPDRAGRLCNLSNRFIARYLRLGALGDLDAAIERATEALEATPGDHHGRGLILGNLSNHLNSRYQRLGALRDLEMAIGYAKAAAAATPEDQPQRAVWLYNLSKYLGARYLRFGALDDLEAAIGHAEAAVEMTPPDHPYCAPMLTNLSHRFNARYDRLGALSDLEAAIEHAKAAVAATPKDHLERATWLCNLSNRFGARYRRLRDFNDLEAAIKHAAESIAQTPGNHPNRAAMLSNLSIYLFDRYGRLGAVGDLEEAIEQTEAAVAVTPKDHPHLAGRLKSLSTYLHAWYKQLGAVGDLETAIEHAEAAVAATPRDHPDRATILTTLGDSLLDSVESRERSFHSFFEAWNCQMSPPLIRVLAAQKAGQHLISCQSWGEASALLEDAVRVMPKICLRSLEREDQQHLLSQLSGLASVAASVVIQAEGEASHALKLLELGRGIITGFIIDYRSDLSELKATDPDLFNTFTRLRTEIDSPLAKPLNATDKDQSSAFILSRRKKALEELESTLSDIRQLPAHRDFLLPPAPEDLMKMAEDGPIIVFNTTSLRSDAIIVTTSNIKALELQKLVYAEAKYRIRQIAQLVKGPLRTYALRNNKMKELLIWLWDVAVEPVLEELQLGETNDTNLTRIWWIGVGELSMAPFHAAGEHLIGSTRNTLSRVVSSYIPTIKALSYSRRKKLNLVTKPDPRILFVTMPTTPGEPPLPKVKEEVGAIVEIIERGATRTTVLEQPSAARVLEQLQLYDAVHFACHGVPDNSNPSNSNLVLLNSSIGTTDKLTVQDISNTNTENAQLAYLSACSTAENSVVALVDETIHLASAFQLAGFNHVLATLWASRDSACMEVAKTFYDLLFNFQERDKGHRRVSTALHEAVKRVREKRPDRPLTWAPFIHTGA